MIDLVKTLGYTGAVVGGLGAAFIFWYGNGSIAEGLRSSDLVAGYAFIGAALTDALLFGALGVIAGSELESIIERHRAHGDFHEDC